MARLAGTREGARGRFSIVYCLPNGWICSGSRHSNVSFFVRRMPGGGRFRPLINVRTRRADPSQCLTGWIAHNQPASVRDLSTYRDFAGQIIHWGNRQDRVSKWVRLPTLAVRDSGTCRIQAVNQPPPTLEQPPSNPEATVEQRSSNLEKPTRNIQENNKRSTRDGQQFIRDFKAYLEGI